MGEAAGSEANERSENSSGEADRETITTGEAAKILGLSVAAARRLCDSGRLEFWQTEPDGEREDTRGRKLRGHRRVYRDSAERLRDAMRKPSAQHS